MVTPGWMVTHRGTDMVTNRDRYRQTQSERDINRPTEPGDRDSLERPSDRHTIIDIRLRGQANRGRGTEIQGQNTNSDREDTHTDTLVTPARLLASGVLSSSWGRSWQGMGLTLREALGPQSPTVRSPLSGSTTTWWLRALTLGQTAWVQVLAPAARTLSV